MMAKIKIKKNDTVIVRTGNSKGVKGKVIKVFPKENRAMGISRRVCMGPSNALPVPDYKCLELLTTDGARG